ncbi:MAG: Tn7 transposase TnsA N-terminal domain-containing protein [Cyclobacteriaceae bacterium]|nr:Tn7 transposase TnsA N-terminal domain-containing protein [Cyclobacteriaceae bacterium]
MKHGPVRKVRSNGFTVVGEVSTAKAQNVQFESSLEEGFILILNFDPDVVTIKDQPIRIPYTNADGITSWYTPDFLVHYKNRKPVLFEVKTLAYLRKYRKELKARFDAAIQFAKERGWDFCVITDKEILTQYVENLSFLLGFQTNEPTLAIVNRLLTSLGKPGKWTPQLVLELATSDVEKLDSLTCLWVLVIKDRVKCNLKKKLLMNTRVSIKANTGSNFLRFPYK